MRLLLVNFPYRFFLVVVCFNFCFSVWLTCGKSRLCATLTFANDCVFVRKRNHDSVWQRGRRLEIECDLRFYVKSIRARCILPFIQSHSETIIRRRRTTNFFYYYILLLIRFVAVTVCTRLSRHWHMLYHACAQILCQILKHTDDSVFMCMLLHAAAYEDF